MNANLRIIAGVTAIAAMEHMRANRLKKKNQRLVQEKEILAVQHVLLKSQTLYLLHMLERHNIQLDEFDAFALANPHLNLKK